MLLRMAPSLAAMVAAVLAVAGPGPVARVGTPPAGGETRVALAIPEGLLEELARAALAVPPWTVVRETRYYGTVTVDHRAHLKRRASCRGCHGPGPVAKIEFTPKVAHSRCIGCHQEVAKGPTACQGCHVKSEPPPIRVVAAPVRPPPPAPPKPDPANVAAALAALSAHADGAGGGDGDPFHRSLEVGLVAGQGQGFLVRLASRQDRIVLTQSVERMSSGSEARTLALMGAGISRRHRPSVSLEAFALAGLDLVDRPGVVLRPALGARAGVEWRTGLRFPRYLSGSLTGVVDLTGTRAPGGAVGRFSIYAALATGLASGAR